MPSRADQSFYVSSKIFFSKNAGELRLIILRRKNTRSKQTRYKTTDFLTEVEKLKNQNSPSEDNNKLLKKKRPPRLNLKKGGRQIGKPFSSRDRKSTRLNSSHITRSRMPSSA